MQICDNQIVISIGLANRRTDACELALANVGTKIRHVWHEWPVSKGRMKIGTLRAVDTHFAQAISKHFA